MNAWEGALLGLLQGLTEFLPVSSSGHIELLRALLGIRTADNLAVTVAVHMATALSIVTVYRSETLAIVRDTLLFRRRSPFFRWGWLIVLSAVPVAVVGLLWEKEIEMFFTGRVGWVGVMLMVTGVLLWLTGRVSGCSRPIDWKGALMMGIAQTVAVLPGISRSGATISTGLLGGYDRDHVTRFAFLMVLPPILGATLIKTLDLLHKPAAMEAMTLPLAVAFVAAYVSGVVACRWMIRLVQKSKLIYFAYYCVLVGLVALIFEWVS